MKITKIHAMQILDSRGNPTLAVKVVAGKYEGLAKVPSGASTGIHEAWELRDGGKAFGGKGVMKAVKHVNTSIARKLKGMDVHNQKALDAAMIELDGTSNKKRLGANAILGVSMACARTSAAVKKKQLYQTVGSKRILPRPFFNVINGGKHADNPLSFQEFMIAPRAKTFAERYRIGAEVYHELKNVIGENYGKSSTNVGDEGGFAPNLKTGEAALQLLTKAVRNLGYTKKVDFAMDAAASEFYDKKKKKYLVDGKWITAQQLSVLYLKLIKKYPLISIEDPFAEDDFKAWADFMATGRDAVKKKRIKKFPQIVGDDLLVTNVDRIRLAMRHGLCDALLLKVNQIGTLTEAIAAAQLAISKGWHVMVSHRSGETSDTFIADLVVALGCGQIKSGAPCRSERAEKYNRLLEIEEKF